MLVLSRKIGETIMVNDNIEITVVRLRGGSVRIGLTAPQEVDIRRGEIVGRGGAESFGPQRRRLAAASK